MKILLDNIIYSKTRHGGISNYWYQLSKFLLEAHSSDTDLVFFDEKGSLNNYHRQKLNYDNSTVVTKSNNLFLSRLSPVFHKTDDSLIYHSSYYRPLVGAGNATEVTTIHDFTHDYFFPWHKRIVHNKLKYNAIKRSKGIICISQSTYNDLLKFCPPREDQHVRIIYNGVSAEFFPIDKQSVLPAHYLASLKIEPGYLLFVGGRTGYKNFYFVAQLLAYLPIYKLVVVGDKLTSREKSFFSPESLERLILVDNASDSDLNILYNNAFALLYPSYYEGFGLPVVEAMKAGCPVISLRNSSIPEVSGDSAILLDKPDVKAFKDAINRLHNKDFLIDLKSKGILNSQKFSWEKCVSETFDFYQDLY